MKEDHTPQHITYTIELILKEKDGNSVISLSRIIEVYKNMCYHVSYSLNQEKENTYQKIEDVDIDFSFQSNNRFLFIITSSNSNGVHSYMGNMLHMISLGLDDEQKDEFETAYHPNIRYEFKELFLAIQELGVSKVIVKMLGKPSIILTESIINRYITKNDKYNGCKMSVDIQEGMKYISTILSQVVNYVGAAGSQNQFYENPQLIFRGITRFFPSKKSKTCVKKENNEIKESIPSNVINNDEKCDKNIVLPMNQEIELVEKDYIRSSLSVRLRDTSKDLAKNDAYFRTHYVNALEEMIQKAQNMYPGKYTSEMSDLDILADLQHNGGSTCLVDFSKNVLTSIWFACSTDRKYNGYLYCYNIMEDMIKNDALTNIRPEDERMKIAELLAQTYKETNVCSDVETRFCLWEPSKKNNRIFRQDSVFVFGIEPFKVDKHAIKVIGIKSEWKLPILTALKAVFNISGSTVYNDYIGFATNTNKMRPYRKMGDSAYTRGYMNMLKGNYSSALDFLKLSEVDWQNRQNWDEKKIMELHFSLGVCYKGLARQENKIHYYENALLEYEDVISYAHTLIDTPNINGKRYYMHKAIRAYNARITLLYKLSRYEEAIEVCNEIKDAIDNGWLKEYESENTKLTSQYCEVSILELQVLELLSQKKESIDIHKKLGQYVGNQTVESKTSSENPLKFFGLLNEYYSYIFLILAAKDISPKDLKNYVKKTIKGWNANAVFNNNPEEKKDVSDYILWNFTDIKNIIDSMSHESYFYEKKEVLQDITAGVIALRDAFQMYGWWSKES